MDKKEYLHFYQADPDDIDFLLPYAMDSSGKDFFTEDDYYNMPEDTRAELINGRIYSLAAPSRRHQELLGYLYYRIADHINKKGGFCKVYPAPFAVKLFGDNKTIVEPDISVICDLSKLTDRGCTGAPDWIIEITSPGSQGNDYIRKLNLYADAGVREYWIVSPMESQVIVYHLEGAQSTATAYNFEETVNSHVLDGFCTCLNEFAENK